LVQQLSMATTIVSNRHVDHWSALFTTNGSNNIQMHKIIANDLTKKKEKRKKKNTHTQTNGMYLSTLVIKQDM